MCQFKSGIITQDNCYHSVDFDSHEEIFKLFNLKDDPNYMVRVEFVPKTNIYDKNIDNWELKIDQDLIPHWFDDTFKITAKERMITALKETWKERFIFPGEERDEIKNGANWHIGGKIKSVYGSAQIESVYDSAQIESVYDLAQIEYVYDSAQIESVYDSAQIKSVYDSAQIKSVYGSSQIKSVSGSAQIESVYGSAQIEYVSGSAQIKSVSGSAQIKYVYGSAQIKSVSGSAQIKSVSGSAQIIKQEGGLIIKNKKIYVVDKEFKLCKTGYKN